MLFYSCCLFTTSLLLSFASIFVLSWSIKNSIIFWIPLVHFLFCLWHFLDKVLLFCQKCKLQLQTANCNCKPIEFMFALLFPSLFFLNGSRHYCRHHCCRHKRDCVCCFEISFVVWRFHGFMIVFYFRLCYTFFLLSFVNAYATVHCQLSFQLHFSNTKLHFYCCFCFFVHYRIAIANQLTCFVVNSFFSKCSFFALAGNSISVCVCACLIAMIRKRICNGVSSIVVSIVDFKHTFGE